MGRKDQEVEEGKSSKRDDRRGEKHRKRHRREEIEAEESQDGRDRGVDSPSRDRHRRREGVEDRTSSRRHRSREKKRGSRDDDEKESRRREHKRSRHHDNEDGDRPRNLSERTRASSKHDKKDAKEKRHRHHHHHHRSSNSTKDKTETTKRGCGTSGSDRLPQPQIPLGEPLGHPPDRLLDADRDYFAYHEHFWVYLFREERTAFNDLSSSDASRAAFARFASRYNAGTLPAAYYDPRGLPAAALDESKTTQHQWKFRTSDAESKRLHALQEGVRKQTEYVDSSKVANNHPTSATLPMPTAPSETHQRGEPAAIGRDRTSERREHKRMRENVRTVHEELAGGPKDFRERQIEKRKQIGERMHSAARERGAAVELSDDAIYGGGEDSGFRTALAREKDRKARREEKKRSWVEELQRKEQAKQDEMLEKLGLTGLKPGQKIKIAPRSDGP